jgi:hypothetical protein
MINVAEVVLDPDLASTFQKIPYKSGSFDADSNWIAVYGAAVDIFACIQPSSSQDILQFLPEAERSKLACSVYSAEPVLQGDGTTTQSDLVVWHSKTYRVNNAQYWEDYGYYFAIATQLTADEIAQLGVTA